MKKNIRNKFNDGELYVSQMRTRILSIDPTKNGASTTKKCLIIENIQRVGISTSFWYSIMIMW